MEIAIIEGVVASILNYKATFSKKSTIYFLMKFAQFEEWMIWYILLRFQIREKSVFFKCPIYCPPPHQNHKKKNLQPILTYLCLSIRFSTVKPCAHVTTEMYLVTSAIIAFKTKVRWESMTNKIEVPDQKYNF